MTSPRDLETPAIAPLATEEEWNSACRRLEHYLGAHLIQDRRHHLQLTLEVLEKAKVAAPLDPSASPTEIVLRLAQERTESWFTDLAKKITTDGVPKTAQAKVAYFTSGAVSLWPRAFLSADPPAQMIDLLKEITLEVSPDLSLSSLHRKEIDYGPIKNLGKETWAKYSWKQVLQAFLLWVVIFWIGYFLITRYFYERITS
jgi:hypothetical protein